jgi:hypothetical protein
MSNPKEAATQLLQLATQRGVRFPKIFEDKKVLQGIPYEIINVYVFQCLKYNIVIIHIECGTTIMICKLEEGGFDIDGALEILIDKYGVVVKSNEVIVIDDEITSTIKKDASPEKKRKSAIQQDEEKSESTHPKKPKKSEMYTNEGNKAAGDAIMEMAGIYFKNNDGRKGGVYSKAAKAIRETPLLISNIKTAMTLPGVGKGIASQIQELLDTGVIVKLEELRAGIA